MNKILLAFLILLIAPIYSYGQGNHHIDKELSACLDSAVNTPEMMNCYYAALEEWDKELNKYYQLYSAKLNKENKTRLKESQLKWIEFRDKEFILIDRHYLEELEGTMWKPIAVREKLNIVKERALRLKNYNSDLTAME